MQTDAYRLWFTRLVTFVVAALAAASVVYWGLKVWGQSTAAVPSAAVAEQMPAASSQAIARALGGGMAPAATVSAAAPAASRYSLVGVVVFHWTLVLTVAIGCIVVMVMKGPAYVADPYPPPGRE